VHVLSFPFLIGAAAIAASRAPWDAAVTHTKRKGRLFFHGLDIPGIRPPGAVSEIYSGGPTRAMIRRQFNFHRGLFMVKGIRVLGIFVALAAVGCGSSSTNGDGGGGGGSFNTTVSGNKSLSSLSDADKTQLCKDVDTFLKTPAVVTAQCKLAGFLAAALVAGFDDNATDAMLKTTCSQAITSCTSGGGDASSGDSMNMCTTDKFPSTCTATVAELSACIQDFPKMSDNVPDCNSITRSSLSADGGGGPTGTPSTTACDALSTKCPGIFDQQN
jgi:hypothetical protein